MKNNERALILKNRISELKTSLYNTDYIDHKLVKAVVNYIVTDDKTELLNLCEEYKEEIEQRQAWRDEINRLEKELSEV
jgi:hypothetical protein